MRSWWSSLSPEAKAAIIAAIVASTLGPIVASSLGWCNHMRLWFYKSALRKMEDANKAFWEDCANKLPPSLRGFDNTLWELPLEILAKKAGISKWRARAAVRWREDKKKYGDC